MNEEDDRKRKYCLLIIVALLISFLAFSLAQSAQNSADNNANITNVFEIVVNNTNLAPTFVGGHPGTSERVTGTTYFANGSPIQLMVFAHASAAGDTATVEVWVNNTIVQNQSGRPLAAPEQTFRSVSVIVPKWSSYSVNFSNYHHYEWREYPILSGRNGTLSINQTVVGNSFNATYDLTTKEHDANYSAQTFPNHSIYGLVDVLNSSKVNKTGDTMTGNLDMGTNSINMSAPGFLNFTNTAAGAFIEYNGASIIGDRNNPIFLSNQNTGTSSAFTFRAGSTTGTGDAVRIRGATFSDPLRVEIIGGNLTMLGAGKGAVLKSGSTHTPVCAIVNLSDAGVLMTTSTACP